MVARLFSVRSVVKGCFVLFLLTVFLMNIWIGKHFGQPEFDGQTDHSKDFKRAQGIKYVKPVTSPVDSPVDCPYWCYGFPSNASLQQAPATRRSKSATPYFLTAVLNFRIYDWKDLAKLSTRELIQWLQYMSYGGVEHVYLYDAYAFKNESQKEAVRAWVQSGFVTYTDWHHKAVPFSLGGTQAAAHADSIQRWGNLTQWQFGIDMDEYPFCPRDQKPGFLARYLREFETSPDAEQFSELSMQNYLYLGKPLDVTKYPFLIGRIWRRTKKPPNQLVKPVYRPAAVKWPDIHRNSLKYGDRKTLPDNELRMNHYWGARLQNWGDDTQEVLDMTEEDRSMELVVANLYKCISCKPPSQGGDT